MRRLLTTLILLFLCGCQSADTPQDTPSPGGTASPAVGQTSAPKVDEDTVRLKKTTIKTRKGQKWELEAEEIDWTDSRSFAKARAVNWWLVDENDKRWVKVVSPRADVDMDNEIVTFIGETVATRIGFPESLKVNKLVYKGKDRKFYGSQGVTWRRATADLRGDTLTATAELDRVLVKGRVKGKIKGGFDGLKDPKKVD